MASRLALQIAQRHCETTQTVGALRLASNVDTELAEVREVLGGLRYLDDCWCTSHVEGDMPRREDAHDRKCQRARSLYEKLSCGD